MANRDKLTYLKIRTMKDIFSGISENETTAKKQLNMYIIDLKKRYEKEKQARKKKCFQSLIESLDSIK